MHPTTILSHSRQNVHVHSLDVVTEFIAIRSHRRRTARPLPRLPLGCDSRRYGINVQHIVGDQERRPHRLLPPGLARRAAADILHLFLCTCCGARRSRPQRRPSTPAPT